MNTTRESNSSSYSEPFIKSSNTMATMITVHGNNNNSTAAAITAGIPIVSSYSSMSSDELLDDYSTSTFSTNTLSAPPPSPQDASPIDNLFAQHLTSKLQQTLIFATSPSSSYSPPPSYSSPVEQDTGPTTTVSKTNHLSPVLVPGALPLTCTTTYRHSTKLTTRHHHGVDPLELDFLLRRVNRSHHRHSHSLDQPRPYRSQVKRIGGFHKKPSRIPLYTRRAVNYGSNDKDGSRTCWKQNASRQKNLAISTALEKWKQLKHYEQGDNNTLEVDRIVHDLKEMGL